ncbi:hypothetical protein [Kitasatospora sp. NPDC001547]|uniref:hypothetical protein n=1 Tax=Kitasatospora sp. NPDC001547 TaxID=3364015 RepID=UPI0036B95ECA|nr:hypothetical protein KitaXyl93_74960 [Kitasatospora sp. Xyl93]
MRGITVGAGRGRARLAVIAAGAAAVVVGGLVSAQGASAGTVHPTGYTCRSDQTGSYAAVAFGVSLDSCALGNGYNGVAARVGVHNSNGTLVDVCAHAVDLATGAWAYDYQCKGWSGASGTLDFPYHSLPTGKYVISVGFWANNPSGGLTYYGDVQSPQINVTP